MAMQLIVTSELSEKTNLWLHNLTNDLREGETARKLIREYGKHKDDTLYKSVMNIIVQANKKRFKEVDKMCEALEEIYEELMEDKLWQEKGLQNSRDVKREDKKKKQNSYAIV